MPELSLLVAHRDSSETKDRQRLWDFLRERTERLLPEVEICEATDDGEDPFHKTLALNRAAHRASGTYLGLWDSDTWVEPSAVRAGLELLREGGWVRPWRRKLKLNRQATDWVLGLGTAWDGRCEFRSLGRPESVNAFWAAPPFMFARSDLERIGGFDERFRGWGSEDVAFARALCVAAGRPKGFEGRCVHLWHPRIGRSGNDLWPGQDSSAANRELDREYAAARNLDELHALRRETA